MRTRAPHVQYNFNLDSLVDKECCWRSRFLLEIKISRAKILISGTPSLLDHSLLRAPTQTIRVSLRKTRGTTSAGQTDPQMRKPAGPGSRLRGLRGSDPNFCSRSRFWHEIKIFIAKTLISYDLLQTLVLSEHPLKSLRVFGC